MNINKLHYKGQSTELKITCILFKRKLSRNSNFIFGIKDIITKNRNYFNILSLINMTLLEISFMKFYISFGLRFNNLMQYVSLEIIVAFIGMMSLKGIYNKYREK